jgi:hypothetical protein
MPAFILRFEEACLEDEDGQDAGTKTNTYIRAETQDDDADGSAMRVIPRAVFSGTQTGSRVATESSDRDAAAKNLRVFPSVCCSS